MNASQEFMFQKSEELSKNRPFVGHISVSELETKVRRKILFKLCVTYLFIFAVLDFKLISTTQDLYSTSNQYLNPTLVA